MKQSSATETSDERSDYSSKQNSERNEYIFIKDDLRDIIRNEIELYFKNLQLSQTFVKKSELAKMEQIYYRQYLGYNGRSISDVIPKFYLSNTTNEELFNTANESKSENSMSLSHDIKSDDCFINIEYENENLSLDNMKNNTEKISQNDNDNISSHEIKSTQIVFSVAEKFNRSDDTSINPFNHLTDTSSLDIKKLDLNLNLFEMEYKLSSLLNCVRKLRKKELNKQKKRKFKYKKSIISSNESTNTNNLNDDDCNENNKNNVNNGKIQISNSNSKFTNNIKECKTLTEKNNEEKYMKDDLHGGSNYKIIKSKFDTGEGRFDELFYEWREHQMNILYYKKSETSMQLNYISESPDVGTPRIPFPCCDNTIVKPKAAKWPVFRKTPSRERLNSLTEAFF